MGAPKSFDIKDALRRRLDDGEYGTGKRPQRLNEASAVTLRIQERKDRQHFNEQFESLQSKHSSIVNENIEEKQYVRR